jgi:hypothetical protein
MLSKVREHVHEGISNRSRRREVAPVPAISPKTTPPHHELVHRTGNANYEVANACGQGSLVARFDDEMNVIPLHGKVHHAKVAIPPRCAANGEANRREHVLASQRPKERAQRDVDRMGR